MAFIPTPNVARLSVEATLGTASIVNTLWVSKASPFNIGTLTTLLGSLKTFWEGHVETLLDQNYVVTQYRGIAQDSDSAPSITVAATAGNHGGVTTSTPAPLQVACVITLYTENRGRSGRGRVYVGGLPNNACTGATQISATFSSNLSDAFDYWTAALEALTHDWVVVSHYHNGAARSEGLAQVVTDWNVNRRYDTQRRRLGA